MATPRLSMRKTKEILRQVLELGRSSRQVQASIGVCSTTVLSVVRKARAAGLLAWVDVEGQTEEALEALMYPPPAHSRRPRPEPEWARVHAERKRPGVTMELLHLEYLEQHPDGYLYSSFCEHYHEWARARGATMRQVHRAGEKLFVDYAGKKPCIWDSETGERIPVELFIAVLGASNYTYCEATCTQRGPDWIASHARAFTFLGGVPEGVVCDQLRSGVSTPCRYEPGIQRTYEELAQHYGTTVLPARPARPRDKAKVEVAVQIVERWVLARLRDEVFYSLDALNARIGELLEELNARQMRVYQASRRELFERLDRPALRPLPVEPFTFGEWKTAKVNVDYHIELDGHYYSVPHALIHQVIEARMTAATVEIYRRGVRIVSHRRSLTRGRHTTVSEHMPPSHQKHAQWTPSRMIGWAAKTGPHTKGLVEAILAGRHHPEQGYRSCLGILRLGRSYGDPRLEAACARALAVGARTYRQVESILRNGLDRLPLPGSEPEDKSPIDHENVRGPNYYN
jgi:transposase